MKFNFGVFHVNNYNRLIRHGMVDISSCPELNLILAPSKFEQI